MFLREEQLLEIDEIPQLHGNAPRESIPGEEQTLQLHEAAQIRRDGPGQPVSLSTIAHSGP